MNSILSGVSGVSRGSLPAAAVLLPLVFAAILQAGANDGIHGVGVGLGRKPNPSASQVRQVTGPSGTFVFENVQPGSYTIWAELPAGQQPGFSSHSTTITFTAVSAGAANAKMKAAPFSASGPHVMNNTLQVTGAIKPGIFFSEDFTITAPATITGTISGLSARICGKGETEVNGKCIPNTHIPNNVTGSEAISTGAVHCPQGTVLINGKCVPQIEAQANTVNSSRSNIKNNLAVNSNVDPSGPLSITAATCEANSVSVTTNYAAPAGSTWVFTNTTTGKATLFPPNQPVHGANSQLQFTLDASNASYRLVIENSNGISILLKPYLFTCGASGPAAVQGGQAH